VKLTTEQQAAVDDRSTGLAILAGAGTGKTTTLVERIRRILDDGVPPAEVLATTFTRAAAAELEERLNVAHPPVIGTVHSLCARILRDNPEAAQRAEGFSIYDEVDQVDVMRDVARDLCEKDWEKMRHGTLRNNERVMATYEDRMREANAVDYDSLERLATQTMDTWRGRFQHVLIDEAQDISRDQWDLLKALCAPNGSITMVADTRQCQPPGTMVSTPHGPRPIEDLSDGDEVHGWTTQYVQHGLRTQRRNAKGQRVRVGRRDYNGAMVRVSTGSRSTDCTPNHRWLAKWDDAAADLYCTYVMRKAGAWRIGWCKLLDTSAGCKANHLRQRARLEGADAAWILRTYTNKGAATLDESVWAAQYGILTMMFMANKQAALYTQDVLDEAFRRCPGRGARMLLHHHGRELQHPFYEAGRDRYRRGRTTCFEVEAANLLDCMQVPTANGRTPTWACIKVSRHSYTGPVYSLDVEKHHAYVADGLCTLNSIYQWRGGDSKVFTGFADGAKLVSLTHNHRSGTAIVGLANRVQPTLPALVGKGEAHVVERAVKDEPAFVAATVKSLLDKGHSPGSIAILGRTWRSLWAVAKAVRAVAPARVLSRDNDPWEGARGRAIARWLLLHRNRHDANRAALVARYLSPDLDTTKLRGEAHRLRVSLADLLISMHLLPKWSDDIDGAAEAITRRMGDAADERVAQMLANRLRRVRSFDSFESWWLFGRTAQDRLSELPDDVLPITTVHGAKGLEWDTVIVVGSHNFPMRSPKTPEDEAEERCCMYVGVTRARQRLLITRPQTVETRRSVITTARSMFLP
jgi:superfamily I DNA/RNA helicase